MNKENESFTFDGETVIRVSIKDARKLYVSKKVSRVLVYPDTEKIDNSKVSPFCFLNARDWTRKQRLQEFNFNVWLFNQPQYIKLFESKPAFYVAVN